ncbi:MAG TPA: glycosyltransferase family 39 protein [Polyangiales bacterium]
MQASERTVFVRRALVTALAALLSMATWNHVNPIDDPDGAQYMASALSLFSGHGLRSVTGGVQLLFPPGYSFVLGIGWKLGLDPVLSGRLVSLLASVLCVVPLMTLSGRLFGRWTEWAAGLMYAVLPLRIEMSHWVMSESLYVLLLLCALCEWSRPSGLARARTVLTTGVLLSLAYLVRPEGLIAVVVLLALSATLTWRNRRVSWKQLALTALAFALCAAPYVAFVHEHTGRWTASSKTKYNLELAIGRSARVPWDQLATLSADDTRIDRSLFQETRGQFVRRYAHNVVQELGALDETLGVGLIAFALLGLILGVTLRGRPMLDALPFVGVLLAPLGYLPIFYTESRYTYQAALGGVILGAWAATEVARRLSRPAVAPWAASLLVLVLAVPSLSGVIWRVRQAERSDATRAMGAWVAAHTEPGARLLTSVQQLAFFAEHPCDPVPYASLARVLRFARAKTARYLVITNLDSFAPELVHLTNDHDASSELQFVGSYVGRPGDFALLYRIVGGREASNGVVARASPADAAATRRGAAAALTAESSRRSSGSCASGGCGG